jgi:hypothetical protein
MAYLLCGVALDLVCVSPVRKPIVARILESLFSLTPLNRFRPDRGIELLIHDSPEGNVSGDVVFNAPGLCAIKTANGYHLRSGGSFLALDLRSGRAAGSLSAAFMDSPPEDRRGLFLFAFLLLLSERGLYGLHAGGVRKDGRGVLLVGGSGSGKTTLACALIRSGWQYLSDDCVLLRHAPHGVDALAFGRPFHCASAMFVHFPELARGAHFPVSGKRLVDIGPIYPGRFRSRFQPQVILFPEIARTRSSRLIPLDSTATLLGLLGEGAGLLHNRESMAAQMAILGQLAKSARGFRLMHGDDVHAEGGDIDAMCSAA